MFYNSHVGVEYREEPCRSALNKVRGMSFKWSLNPYMGCVHRCTFCYVRGFERRAERPSDDRYGRSIRVKTNVAEVLRRELASPRWTGEHIAMGTATDPYQHCEGRYRLTRGIIEVIGDFENPLSMLTKSTMILRDLALYKRLNEVAPLTISMSVGTLDEDVRRVVEPGTAPGRKRLEILSRFADAGIRTGVLVAPILPGLTDDDEHLEEVVGACAAAGVDYASPIVLHVRSSIREHFMPWMQEHYPWLYPHYVELYGRRSYAPKAFQQEIAERFARLRDQHGIGGSGHRRPDPKSEPRGQLSFAV